MAGAQVAGASHVDQWLCDPSLLTIVTDRSSPFYDERIEIPVVEELVLSVMKRGVIEPVTVIRDGERFVVDDGRQRVRACIEANRRLRQANRPPHKIAYQIKRVGDGDAGIIGLSAAANIHVKDSPMTRARKAQRMVESGATPDDVAVDFGVSRQCVDNWLTLLDCASPVQRAVDEGRLAESAARKLAGLDRERQREVFEQMVAKGATKGAAAARAVAAGKRGRAVPGKSTTRRMRNQAEVQALLDGLQALNGELKDETRPVVDVLRWVLRQCEPDALIDDVAAILLPESGTADQAVQA